MSSAARSVRLPASFYTASRAATRSLRCWFRSARVPLARFSAVWPLAILRRCWLAQRPRRGASVHRCRPDQPLRTRHVPVQLLEVDPRRSSPARMWSTTIMSACTSMATSISPIRHRCSLSPTTITFASSSLNGNSSPIYRVRRRQLLPLLIALRRCHHPQRHAYFGFLGVSGVYGSLAKQTTNTNSYGTSFQVTNTSPVFGHSNQLVAAISFDVPTQLSPPTPLSRASTPLSRNVIPP